MKKNIIGLVISLILTTGIVFADGQADATKFLNQYINAANTYSKDLPSFYASNAKISRIVVKPNGEKVEVPADVQTYVKQMQMNAKIAKIRNYKNYYSEMKVTKSGSNYVIKCKRKPSLSDYKLNAEFTVGKDSSGKWKIKGEKMETKEQIFLLYAPKKK